MLPNSGRWAATGPVPGPISGPDARRAAREELSRNVYHRDGPSLPQRIVNWLLDRLAQLAGHASTPSGVAWLLVIVLIVGLIGLAVWRAGPLRRRIGTPPADGDLLRAGGSVDHRALARQLADSGQFALAVREWLRAAVQTIEDRGVLDPRPGRTGAEVAREAGERLPEAETALRSATTAFEQIWFGRRPATLADVDRAQAAADAVRTARVNETVR